MSLRQEEKRRKKGLQELEEREIGASKEAAKILSRYGIIRVENVSHFLT